MEAVGEGQSSERKKEGGERCVLEEDDGVDRVHVHNHKLHCLI